MRWIWSSHTYHHKHWEMHPTESRRVEAFVIELPLVCVQFAALQHLMGIGISSSSSFDAQNYENHTSRDPWWSKNVVIITFLHGVWTLHCFSVMRKYTLDFFNWYSQQWYQVMSLVPSRWDSIETPLNTATEASNIPHYNYSTLV